MIKTFRRLKIKPNLSISSISALGAFSLEFKLKDIFTKNKPVDHSDKAGNQDNPNEKNRPAYIDLLMSDFVLNLEPKAFRDITMYQREFLRLNFEFISLESAIKSVDSYQEYSGHLKHLTSYMEEKSKNLESLSLESMVIFKFVEYMSVLSYTETKIVSLIEKKQSDFMDLTFLDQMKLLVLQSRFQFFEPKSLSFFLENLVLELKTDEFYNQITSANDMSVFVVFLSSFLIPHAHEKYINLIDFTFVLNRIFNMIMAQNFKYKAYVCFYLSRLDLKHIPFIIKRLIQTLSFDLSHNKI